MMRRNGSIMVAACCLAACAPASVWVDLRRTDAGHLVFRVGPKAGVPKSTGLERFTVLGCGPARDRMFWAIASNNKGLAPVDSIVYGIVPAGFHEDQAALPLGPGCFIASILDGTLDAEGNTYFEIAADSSTVRPLAQDP